LHGDPFHFDRSYATFIRGFQPNTFICYDAKGRRENCHGWWLACDDGQDYT
jgi:hypothetical protein